MTRATTWRCAAFALPELAATLVIVGVAIAMLLVGAGRARLEHNSVAASGQVRWIAGVTSSYAADYEDRMWALSWKAGETPSIYPDLQLADTHQQAVANQAVDIIRRRANEPDLPRTTNWIASVYYSQLPLVDYLDASLPMFEFISPADVHRLNWARDPEAFSRGKFLPFQPDPIPVNKRWPYSASYEVGTALVSTPWSGPDAVSQADSQARYNIPAAAEFGGAPQSDVHFPSRKVLMFDREQRTAPKRSFLHEDANMLMLMADGAAARQRTSDSNDGWHPLWPQFWKPSRFRYDPAPWEAGPGGVLVLGHYRWTRCGAEGRDFGGPEPCGPPP